MAWREVALSEIAHPVERRIQVVPGTEYRTIGVKWWGEGAYERSTIDGAQTAARTLSLVYEDDLIINKIWVRHGSVAVAGPSVQGCAASGEFPTFELDRSAVLPAWMYWQCKLSSFWTKCAALSRGTSGKNRIRPDVFLTIRIRLPALDEQRRIVARIEELAAKVEEARQLRSEADELRSAVVSAEEFGIWPQESVNCAPRLAEVTTYLSRGRQSRQGPSEHYLIKTQHVQMGQYVPTSMTLAHDAAARVQDDALVRTRDVLIACSAAGCLGRVAFYDGANRTVSTDTHVAIARADTTMVEPEYLYCYLRGAQGQRQLRSRERGDWQREKVGFRLTELNLADLRQVPVPVPALPEQGSIVRYLQGLYAKVGCATQIAAVADRELSLLTPAILSHAFDGGL